MKKLLFLFLAAAFSFGAIAQGNHGNGKNKKQKHEKKHNKKDKDDDDHNGQWRNDDNNRDRDEDWRDDERRSNDRRDNGSWNNNNQNTSNAPRKVRDAFYRDYPNATNVNWSKDRGVWTASFRRSGIFGGNTSVSYRANGQRVDNNTWANRGSTDRNGNTNKGTSVFDKIRGRNN